jgi:uncharacterized protein (TIGR02588 family)
MSPFGVNEHEAGRQCITWAHAAPPLPADAMKAPARNPLGWAMAGLGLGLVAVTIGFLAYQATADTEPPPQLRVEAGTDESRVPPASAGQGHAVEVWVTNQGGRAARDIQVEAMLENAGTPVEVSTLRLELVPPGSRRRGWVSFLTDPATVDRLQLRVVGYQDP